MKCLVKSIVGVVVCAAMSSVSVYGVTVTTENFGSGGSAMSMNFVDVGDAGNAADTDTATHRLGRGSVGYNYRMGQTEVSEGQIAAYNADAANSTNLITLDSRGVNSPATSVSWNEAARFVNWLNTSQGYQEAYKFSSTGGNTNITLWTAGDAGYDAGNEFRNSMAHYVLPSADEWYKAAYHQGDDTYHNWATGATAPTATTGGTTAGTAVYRDGVNANPAGPAIVGNAGGLSFYGTMAQTGNVWEWEESAYDGVNNTAVESRELRGGYWSNFSFLMSASNRANSSPASEDVYLGFRVAVVPEPSAWLLCMVGGMTLLVKRRRG